MMNSSRPNRVSPVAAGWRSASSLVLALGFGLTGAGTVMLGVLLPFVAKQWGLPDDAAGLLFFLQFAGSALGAVFTGLHRVRTMRIGYGLLVLAAIAMEFAGPRNVYAIFFCFGIGLGMAMTATSLLFSDRFEADRAQKLEGLNFAWSAGAMAAPLLFLPFARAGNLKQLFIALPAVFALMLVWAMLRERSGEGLAQAATEVGQPQRVSAGAVAMLIGLAVGAVGIETALSSWLTSYVHRIAPLGHGALFPVTLFYLGVVVSRLLSSTVLLSKIGQVRALQGLLWGTTATVAFLISLHGAWNIDAAAALAGICIGPLYPLALALLLQRTSRGWVFAMAGAGAALFPWLTGLCSAHFGSLRYGLLVPLAAGLAMAVLRPIFFRPSGGAGEAIEARAGRATA